VESDIVRVSKVQGIPRFVSSGYVGFIPVMRFSDAERARFSQTVRLGFDYSIYDSWLRNDLQEAYSLGKILATFDLSHYDHFLGLARTCVQLGKIQEAKENYDKAIEVCNADQKWNKLKSPLDASIEDIIENLEKEKASLPQK